MQSSQKFLTSRVFLFSNPCKLGKKIYKVFCLDIDKINEGEFPFGYGVRADGKILLGARAQEWLEKSLQKGE